MLVIQNSVLAGVVYSWDDAVFPFLEKRQITSDIPFTCLKELKIKRNVSHCLPPSRLLAATDEEEKTALGRGGEGSLPLSILLFERRVDDERPILFDL